MCSKGVPPPTIPDFAVYKGWPVWVRRQHGCGAYQYEACQANLAAPDHSVPYAGQDNHRPDPYPPGAEKLLHSEAAIKLLLLLRQLTRIRPAWIPLQIAPDQMYF